MAQVSYGTITITDVTDGAMTAIIYLYQRAATEPQSMPGNLVYDFDDGSLSGTMNNWVQSIEDLGESTNPIWMIAATATATSTNSTDEIASTEWQGPIILAQNGQDGTPGKGISSTTIKYGISSSSTVEPANWVDNVPTLTKGDWLWVRTYYLYTDNSNKTTYTKSYIGTDGEDGSSVVIQSASKSEGVTTIVISDGTTTSTLTINDGEDGDNGTPGAPGADGVSAYVHVAWANSSDGSVDFSTSDSSGKEYLGVYTDNTQADSQINTDYSWSLIKGEDGQDGQDGQDGDPGAPGYNQATIYLYQRADDGLTGPNVPSGNLTYDFSNGTFTSGSIGSWSRSVPTTDNKKPCWITTAVAISQNSSVTIVSSAWSTPVKLVEDGADGTNGTNGTNGLSVTALRELYYLKTNSTNPSRVTPQTTIYSTDEANKWTTIIPSYSGTGTYYTCVETTLSDSSKVWSAPIVNDGLTTTNANAFTAAQGITLMGGHFIYKGTTSTSRLTIPSANVVECINDNSVDVTNDPTKWKHNVHIGANGIGLRYNEATLSQWNTSGLTFYKPATSGNNVIQGGKAMELTGSALSFYGSNQNTPDSYLGDNGLVTTKGVIGGWTINENFLYSLDRDEWDLDKEGIFIGKRTDDSTGQEIFTLSGGKRQYISTKDTSPVYGTIYYKLAYIKTEDEKFKGSETYYYKNGNDYIKVEQKDFYEYILTEDTEIDSTKRYYKEEDNEYILIEDPQSELPSETTPTEAGWYEASLKSPKEEEWFVETYEEVTSPTGDPSNQSWYESAGPMWYINSDGSASFGSLVVNQQGSLDVPAASITGTLTADQIEVNNLGAISANIGATIEQGGVSNTLTIGSKYEYVLTLDSWINPSKNYYKPFVTYEETQDIQVISGKKYYRYSDNEYIIVDNPTGNPSENNWYEQIASYKKTEDTEVINGKDYFIKQNNEFIAVVNPTGNPHNNGWYEFFEYEEIEDEESQYELSEDTVVNSNKIYFEYDENSDKYIIIDNPTGNPHSLDYYELIPNPNDEGWYEKIENSEISFESNKIKYTLTTDTIVKQNITYYEYLVSYVLTSDTAPREKKDYYKIDDTATGEDISYVIEPYTQNPVLEKLYERSFSYREIDEEKRVGNPFEKCWYVKTNESNVNLMLKDAVLTISSDSDELLSVNPEEEKDVNISALQITNKIKIGQLEIATYNNGIAIRPISENI